MNSSRYTASLVSFQVEASAGTGQTLKMRTLFFSQGKTCQDLRTKTCSSVKEKTEKTLGMHQKGNGTFWWIGVCKSGDTHRVVPINWLTMVSSWHCWLPLVSWHHWLAVVSSWHHWLALVSPWHHWLALVSPWHHWLALVSSWHLQAWESSAFWRNSVSLGVWLPIFLPPVFSCFFLPILRSSMYQKAVSKRYAHWQCAGGWFVTQHLIGGWIVSNAFPFLTFIGLIVELQTHVVFVVLWLDFEWHSWGS